LFEVDILCHCSPVTAVLQDVSTRGSTVRDMATGKTIGETDKRDRQGILEKKVTEIKVRGEYIKHIERLVVEFSIGGT
jgi:hypothetical protein